MGKSWAAENWINFEAATIDSRTASQGEHPAFITARALDLNAVLNPCDCMSGHSPTRWKYGHRMWESITDWNSHYCSAWRIDAHHSKFRLASPIDLRRAEQWSKIGTARQFREGEEQNCDVFFICNTSSIVQAGLRVVICVLIKKHNDLWQCNSQQNHGVVTDSFFILWLLPLTAWDYRQGWTLSIVLKQDSSKGSTSGQYSTPMELASTSTRIQNVVM